MRFLRNGFPVCILLLGSALWSAVAPIPSALAAPAGSVVAESKQVNAAGKSFSVSLVHIDLLDPTLQVTTAIASYGIGYDEDFGSMAERTNAVAAINGTFFNSYEKDESVRYPNGLLAEGGAIEHSGENQSLIVSKDKAASIRNVQVRAQVGISHNGGKPYPITPWGVNKYYGDDQIDQAVLFTPAFGRMIAFPNGINIVIDGGSVKQVTSDPVAVPEDGYAVFVGLSENNKINLLPNVHVGDTAAVAQSASASDGGAVDPQDWLAAIGVGPKLVTAGAVDVDFARDGFSDPKITEQANRRSFVGIGSDGKLVMGTTAGTATIAELAEIALALGLTDAMNMDGGSSTALYANGTMLAKPGRKLSNALIVRKLEHPVVQIAVNGVYRSDYRGFIAGETTMVPFRPLLESMKADFRWDDNSRTLMVKNSSGELRMKPDVGTVTLGGASKLLESAPSIVDGHMYVPLRFVVETYGGSVTWDGRLYRVDVKLP